MAPGGTRGSPVARGVGRSVVRAGWRWLTRLHPLHSWLLVMGVILVLSMLGLRLLALAVAVGWTGYALFTWLTPAAQARVRRLRRRLGSGRP